IGVVEVGGGVQRARVNDRDQASSPPPAESPCPEPHSSGRSGRDWQTAGPAHLRPACPTEPRAWSGQPQKQTCALSWPPAGVPQTRRRTARWWCASYSNMIIRTPLRRLFQPEAPEFEVTAGLARPAAPRPPQPARPASAAQLVARAG